MSKEEFFAFTLKAKGRLAQLLTDEVQILNPVPQTGGQVHGAVSVALWDTGASGSVVTQNLAKALKLAPIRKQKVNHAGGTSDANVYLCHLKLPNGAVINNIQMTECADAGANFGLIIGMDVITCGDFSITNVGGNTTFSFRMPSVTEIDYYEQKNGKS